MLQQPSLQNGFYITLFKTMVGGCTSMLESTERYKNNCRFYIPALQILFLLTCSKIALLTLQNRNTQDSDSIENHRKPIFSLQYGRFQYRGWPNL